MRGRFDYSQFNFCANCKQPKPKTMLRCDNPTCHNVKLRTRARFKGGRVKLNSIRTIRIKGSGDGEFEVQVTRRFDADDVKTVKARTVLKAIKEVATG